MTVHPTEGMLLRAPGGPVSGHLSPIVAQQGRTLLDLRVPMRDGIELALDVVLTDLLEPRPVVLVRTPYDKTLVRESPQPLHRRLIERGYVLAFNDVRGRFNSDGEFYPYFSEADDGYDTVEWVAAQDWCDGRVGMLGGSYAGQTQWYAASRVPPHLKAIVPLSSPPSSLWRNEPIFNGVLMMGLAEWGIAMGRRSWQTATPHTMLTEPQPTHHALPVQAVVRQAGADIPWWDEMLNHPTLDEFWERGSYANYEQMTVPALNVTGWWDLNFPGAPLNFQAMRERARTAEARQGQKLVIGPWPHAPNTTTTLSGVDFGHEAVIALDDYIISFYDRWLLENDKHVQEEPSVYVFVTGANEWWAADSFPLPGTADVPFYFHSAGSANTSDGDGRLSREMPHAEERPDTYRYDPSDVAVTTWHIAEGPVDDHDMTRRPDILCYTSEPLAEPLDVVGWVTCRLYAATSASDTDWHARLVDVQPDGTARFLCRGALRARFRESLSHPSLLTPDEPDLFEFTMDATGVRFEPGHRIRVEISSSWFTRYDRNLNQGSPNPWGESHPTVAEQVVFHDPERPSHVVLPLVPRPAQPQPA